MVQNNQKCVGEQDLCSRSDATRQKLSRQGTGTANRQNQRKLNFTPQLFPIWLQTVEENSLENISQDLVQLTVPTPDTYPQASAAFFIQNQKKGRRSQTHLHLHWAGPRNKVLTLQDLESQQERTLESQPVHLVIFTCKDTSTSGLVDYQSKS